MHGDRRYNKGRVVLLILISAVLLASTGCSRNIFQMPPLISDFHDTFSGGDLSQWNTSSAAYGVSWSITNGSLVGSISRGVTLSLAKAAIGTHRLTFRCMAIGRVSDGESGCSLPYWGIVWGDLRVGRYAMLIVSDDGRFAVRTIDSGKADVLADWRTSDALLSSGWNTILISSLDGFVDIYANGELIFSRLLVSGTDTRFAFAVGIDDAYVNWSDSAEAYCDAFLIERGY